MLVPDSQRELTFFRELLPGGKLSISGKVNKDIVVKQIEISIDGKNTWRKIKISENNTFHRAFRVKDADKRYDLYIRVTDEKGDINNIDATNKIITFQDKSLYNTVRETIDGLIDAYQMRASGRFMSYVDESYTGEKIILDRAIRNDFSQAHDISIQYILNSVVPDYKGKVYVSLHFTRSYIDIKTGQRKIDEGITSIIFNIDTGKPTIYSMRGNPLFGFK